MHGQQNIKSLIHIYGITITQHCVHDYYKMNRNAENVIHEREDASFISPSVTFHSLGEK